ncbi:hypothetical protein [Flavobacterium sp.]|uniref:hypothetical protein n=1 Tax=Flavobacterium sp. TaxID=239 RepID=UPI0039E4CAFC
MKRLITIINILLISIAYGQTTENIEKESIFLFEKRNYFINSRNEFPYDSIPDYNRKIEKFILKSTSTNPETLNYKFKNLINLQNGLNIITSEDKLFRIYNWNTLEGGTMQFYKNVFQYSSNGNVYSKLSKIESEDDIVSVNFYEINDLKIDDKNYYITFSVFVASSALYYFEANIFSIENGELIENVNLFKTKEGLTNTLVYEIDLTNSINQNRKNGIQLMENMDLVYDKKNKTIIIPLIKDNGKLTNRKIKYKLKDKYFEKV